MLQPLSIRADLLRQVLGTFNVECNALGLGHRFKLAPQRVQHGFEHKRLGMNGQLPGLDLGQIQNFVDQVQQVAAAFVDHPGRLGLLGGEVALLVVGQLAGQNQHAVQRGAQLMRHIGQELGLVLRGLLQLPGRRLELGALPGQHLAFLFQLLVGRPQLFTLLLEFFLRLAQRLRLFL